MTIHFAAARPAVAAYLGGAGQGTLTRRAANDNPGGSQSQGVAHDHMLRDALKHFAAYGLGAARQARLEAERCFRADELEGYRYWREICGKFDRRMAAALARKYGD